MRFNSPLAALAIAVLSFQTFAMAQDRISPAPPMITERIDDTRLHTLIGNTRSAANPTNDRGRVADDLALDHMLLQLTRPPEQEAALKQYMDDLQNRESANYHKWLTAEKFGEYGPSPQDIKAVTDWLEAHGFTVNQVYPSGMAVDFSGTAAHVRQTLHTEIHRLNVNGVEHFANMSDPQIPAALSAVVSGVVSLHDFSPKAMNRPRTDYTYTSGSSTYQAVVPADLATIYTLNPVFSSGNTGQGQTIVVIEDSNIYKPADFNTFRAAFGLNSIGSGSLVTVHPAPSSGTNNCSDPGVVGNTDAEVTLDAEWASAAAPGATIEIASCKDTRTTFGGLIALQNLANSSTPPSIVSVSYGECEAENGATANAAYNSVYQQLAAEHTSVFVSSGDEGAASCDANLTNATHGIGVSGFASTPYNVAVGGTDFGDSYAGSNSTYWNSSNGSTYGSAKSYVPEIPWNDSCASLLLSNYFGYTVPYGASGFCNSTKGKQNYLTTAAGSGGPSGCASGSPSITGEVTGTCKGYSKPSWQSGVIGIPSDRVRDIPDVSLFAANGVWGHYYVFCWSDTAYGGAACTGAPSGWAGAGGTSFSSPIMAGIQALINHQYGSQGNPNPVYYRLAGAEYGATGSATCNSTNGASPSCTFYDVTQGDIDVNCKGTVNCYGATSTGRRGLTNYGALSTSSASFSSAYATGTGWDFATGLGTVNAYNLVQNWNH